MRNVIVSSFTKLMSVSMIMFMAMGFASCSGDDDPAESKTGGETSPIVGKWEVSNQNAQYGSFEFTGDRKYIITRKVTGNPSLQSKRVLRSTSADAQPVYIIIIFGDYSQLSDNDGTINLNLSDFGTITITVNPENGTASITVNGETYTVSKTEEVDNSERTELLCHTWKLDPEENPEGDASITFSKAGTYVITGTDEKIYNTRWEWANASKNKLKMELELEDWVIDTSGNYVMINREIIQYLMDVLELNETTLKLQQEYEEDGEIVKDTLFLHR